jgi:NADPH:quinone reductase-like Zn-dependent oxidoreductase
MPLTEPVSVKNCMQIREAVSRSCIQMRAAVVSAFGTPRVADFPPPEPAAGRQVLDVLAAGVNHVDLARAAGAFYVPPPPFPWVAGTDGVGLTAEGRRVYFEGCIAPFGALAEQTLVAEDALVDIPDGVASEIGAALGNAGLAAWLGLHSAAEFERGERVLVLGATGTVGSLAVQLARLGGAATIVAAGRSRARLERARELGADAVVELEQAGSLARRLAAAAPEGFDVVIDALWGDAARSALAVARTGCRHVQLGHIAGPTATLPAVALRAKHVSLIGFAVFHASKELRRHAYSELTALAIRGQLRIDVEALPLANVERAWQLQREGAGRKLVIVIDAAGSPLEPVPDARTRPPRPSNRAKAGARRARSTPRAAG